MSDLLLLSKGLDALKNFVGASPADVTVGFIPTAADPYEDKWFMEADRQALIDSGFQLREVNLKGIKPEELQQKLKGVDVVYVTGGNTFYLLEQMRASGFKKLLPTLLAGGVKYVGTSAGTIVVGPDLEPVEVLDEPSKANLSSTKSLGIVDFVPLPHFDSESEQYQSIIEKYGKRFSLVPIDDAQAILVKDGKYEVIESA